MTVCVCVLSWITIRHTFVKLLIISFSHTMIQHSSFHTFPTTVSPPLRLPTTQSPHPALSQYFFFTSMSDTFLPSFFLSSFYTPWFTILLLKVSCISLCSFQHPEWKFPTIIFIVVPPLTYLHAPTSFMASFWPWTISIVFG